MNPRSLVLVAIITLAFASTAPVQARSISSSSGTSLRALVIASSGCSAPPSGTPVSDAPLVPDLPAGVDVQLLAFHVVEMPQGPYNTFELGQFELEPDTQTSVQEGNFSGPGLLYVESGEVTIHLPNNTDMLLCAGAQTPLAAWTDYSARNSGSEIARLVRIRIGTGMVTGAYASDAALVRAGLVAAPLADGGYEPEPLGDGVTYYPLVIADLHEPLPESAQLFLADTRWQPGARFDDWIFCGPVGLAVEAGVLTGQEPPLPNEAQFPQGHFVFYPPHDSVRLRNEETDSAEVLMAGVIPKDQVIATPSPDCSQI